MTDIVKKDHDKNVDFDGEAILRTLGYVLEEIGSMKYEIRTELFALKSEVADIKYEIGNPN